jgi:hypothetical protein
MLAVGVCRVILTNMQTRLAAVLIRAVIVLVISCSSVFHIRSQSFSSDPTQIIKHHEELARRFKAGDTNVPVLATTWYGNAVEGCSVYKSGKVLSGWSGGLSNASSPNKGPLDNTNQLLLIETINSLPPPPKLTLSHEHQIVISGVRSNHWFRRIYDRANIPKEVEKLYEITGAPLKRLPPNSKAIK